MGSRRDESAWERKGTRVANEQENPEQNKAAVQRLAAELSRGNLKVFDEMMGPGYIAHRGMDTLDLDAVMQEYRTLLAAFPDGSWTLELLLAAEEGHIVARGTFRGMQAAPYAGVGPAGQHVAVPFIWIYRFSGGKIREGWGWLDQLALVQQIGGRIVPS